MATGADLRRPVEILLVDDSPSDVDLSTWAIQQSQVHNVLHHVENGVEALAFLRQQGQYSAQRIPDIVLLDWNMPRKNGREVLQEVRGDSQIGCIPVIVLSTSDDEHDVRAAYSLSANAYIKKTAELHEFVAAIKSFAHFFLQFVVLPTSHEPSI